MATIQESIEKKLKQLLEGKGEKDDEKRQEELQILALAIKWAAVKAKLDFEDWGKDLDINGNEREAEPNRKGAVRP